MKIALLVEGSSRHHAKDIFEVLSSFPEHKICNVGMRGEEGEFPLTFLHTSMIAGILLNLRAVDFVVGGCGSGQGFINGVLAFPNVLCGLIHDPLEAWLYMQVNAGNCISLPFNKGWGLAGKEGLKITLEQLFSVPVGGGYPPERADIIKAMHAKLRAQSNAFRKPFLEIIPYLDREVLSPALRFQGVRELIESAPDSPEKAAVTALYSEIE